MSAASAAAPQQLLTGRRVVVVGASSGIGRHLALRAAALGGEVVFAGRRAALLEEAVAAAGSGHAVPTDVSDPAQCEALVVTAVERMGGIDLIVVASSVSTLRKLRDSDAAYWDQLMRTNVVGPSLVIRAALPHLSADAIVSVISSDSVETPFPGISPYAASKAALNNVMESWRTEEPHVRFSRITVGATAGTDFGRDFDPAATAEMLTTWASLGRLFAQMMDPEALGRLIADTLAHALATPGVEPQQLRLMPAGGPFTGDVSALLAGLAEAAGGA